MQVGVEKMAPLPQVENQFTPQEVWSTSVGDGVGDFYSNLEITDAISHRGAPHFLWRKLIFHLRQWGHFYYIFFVWSTSVGDGVGDFYSNLHPAWQDTTVFAADRFGIVMLHTSCGVN
jgi:outer membrane protein assembly factor BamB